MENTRTQDIREQQGSSNKDLRGICQAVCYGIRLPKELPAMNAWPDSSLRSYWWRFIAVSLHLTAASHVKIIEL